MRIRLVLWAVSSPSTAIPQSGKRSTYVGEMKPPCHSCGLASRGYAPVVRREPSRLRLMSHFGTRLALVPLVWRVALGY
jgi:hypothetical protein